VEGENLVAALQVVTGDGHWVGEDRSTQKNILEAAAQSAMMSPSRKKQRLVNGAARLHWPVAWAKMRC
jgi:DNA-directed RNA polymerase alpha subunit